MTEETPISIAPPPYPGRRILRGAMRFFGRSLMSLVTRPTITGVENLPTKGPLILVGNHVAVLEAVLMVLYVPWEIEVLAAGEIPLDPRYAPIAKQYGYIPVRRGEMDREAMNTALGVLNQGGIIGMFPEGGIWETTLKRARTGVSWLSYHANAPILPIGFGGIDGALGAAFKLKRPRLFMNIGRVIPPIGRNISAAPRKAVLEDGAKMVMSQIEALIPEADKQRWNRIRDERFEFHIKLLNSSGAPIELPEHLCLSHPDSLGKFFHRPLLLDVLSRNLNLPVQPLQRLQTERNPARISEALIPALNYYDTNPGFLSYRFGYAEAGQMREGLRQLHAAANWAVENQLQIELIPIRRFHRRGHDEEIVETYPGSVPAL